MVRESQTRRPHPAPRSETADQLLAAAAALMTERNTIDVPVADVAARAGLNAALVNYYFRTKTGLHIALVRRDAEVAVAEMNRLLATGLPPAEKMRRHLTGIIRTFQRCPYLYRLMRALLRDADSKAAREIVEFFSKPVIETQKAILQEGIASGAFRPVDPMMFHLCAIGACDQLFAEQSTLRWSFGVAAIDDDLARSYGEFVVDLLMKGFLARA